MMDHAAAHERIADLALEPGGLEAALAPDAPDRALAAHVITCEACQADVATWLGVHGRLGRALAAGRPGERPDIDPIEPGTSLRAGVLAAATAEPRPRAIPTAGRGVARPAFLGIQLPRFSSTLVGLAAALVVAVGGTYLLAGPTANLLQTVDEARTLSAVVTAVNRVLADPDHRVVGLRTPDGRSGGSITLARHDLVILTSAISEPAEGSVYRCWLRGADDEILIGRMHFARGTAYWVGSLDEWASISLAPGTGFFVSLETGPEGAHHSGPVVLEADL